MRSLIFLLAVTLVVPCVAPSLRAQDSAAKSLPSNMLKTEGGGTIEFLGLDKWTPEDIRDSVKKYGGYDILAGDAHACGAVLRYKVHFADAASIFYRTPDGGTSYIVTVTEPEDSARVKHRFLPLDTTGGRADWAEARAAIKQRGGAFRDVMMTALAGDSAKLPIPLQSANDSAALKQLRTFFAAHQSKGDKQTAMDVLQSDSDFYDRQLAVVMLMHFGHDDDTWNALSQTMLESDGSAQGDAVTAMRMLVSAGERPDKLTALAPAFHAVLDGTSQFEIFSVMPLLSALNPDTTMAKPLLKDGGHLLVAYAGAHFAPFQQMAVRLLRQLSGQDFGTDTAKWSAWIASLG